MLTYNDIYEASRKEKYSEQLQKLPKNFVKEFAEYIKEKKKIISQEDESSDNSIKTKKQIENAQTLFKELIRKRKSKILQLVLIASETGISKQDFDSLLNFEKDLFEKLTQCVNDSDSSLYSMMSEKGKEESSNDLIIFKEDVKEFMGFNGVKMGPYEKDQIANIPRDVANILIEDGKAEFVEE
ncbi:MAG: hypothetical protein ACOC3Z_00865 [Nanoarchaeota archaeon]